MNPTEGVKISSVTDAGKVGEQRLSPDQQFQAIHDRLTSNLKEHDLDPDHPTEGELRTQWTGNSGVTYSISIVSPTGPDNLEFLATHNGQRWGFSYNHLNPVTGTYLQYLLWEDNPEDSQKTFLIAYDFFNVPGGDFINSLYVQGRLKRRPFKVDVFEKFDVLLQDLSPQQQSDSQPVPPSPEVE